MTTPTEPQSEVATSESSSGLLEVPMSNWADGESVAPNPDQGMEWVSKKESSESTAATSKASKPTSEAKRKRGRPPKSSVNTNSKISSLLEGKKSRKITKGNLQSKNGLSMHQFESSHLGCSERSAEEVIDESAKNMLFEDGRSVSSNGNFAELASVNDTILLEHQEDSNQEVQIMSASAEATKPNLPKNESGQFNPKLQTLEELKTQPQISNSFQELTSVWDSLLSLGIFRAMPQRPHFSSLKQMGEDHREGIELGHMYNFAKLAYSLPMLGPDDSINVLEMKLGALEEFKQHGFDIGTLKCCLENLIGIKRMLQDLTEEQSKIEAVITHNTKQCSELAHEVDEIDKNIEELEGRILFMVSRKVEIMDAKEEHGRIKSEMESRAQIFKDKCDDLRKEFQSLTKIGRNGF